MNRFYYTFTHVKRRPISIKKKYIWFLLSMLYFYIMSLILYFMIFFHMFNLSEQIVFNVLFSFIKILVYSVFVTFNNFSLL